MLRELGGDAETMLWSNRSVSTGSHEAARELDASLLFLGWPASAAPTLELASTLSRRRDEPLTSVRSPCPRWRLLPPRPRPQPSTAMA
jgi:hypothetical protein